MGWQLACRASVVIDTAFAIAMRERVGRGWMPWTDDRVEEEGAVTLICPPRTEWSAHTVQMMVAREGLSIEVWADDARSLASVLAGLVLLTGETRLTKDVRVA